jgi:hypothetical protein
MKGIRIEGFSRHVGKLTLFIEQKHIMTVLTAYQDVLPCSAFESLEQYYVMFYPSLDLPPIITTSELSPDIKEWIYTVLNTY